MGSLTGALFVVTITLIKAQESGEKDTLETSVKYTPIDNDNLYEEHRDIKPGQKPYPVIFEPIKNIKLSISSYQVTTFVDLGPYFEYFTNYERYLDRFLEDLGSRSKMWYLAKYHQNAQRLKQQFSQSQLDEVDCDRQDYCERNTNSPLCQRLIFSFCMTQRQYYQITNATVHLKEMFQTLKTRFLGMIDYLDETLHSIKDEMPNTKSRKKRDIANQGNAIQLKEKDRIVHDMNTLDEIINWVKNQDKRGISRN